MNLLQRMAGRVLGYNPIDRASLDEGLVEGIQREAVEDIQRAFDDAVAGWLRSGLSDDMTDSGPDWQDKYRRAVSHPERSSIVMDNIEFTRRNTARVSLQLERRSSSKRDDWSAVANAPMIPLLKSIIYPSLKAMSLWGNALWAMTPITNGGRPLGFKYLHPSFTTPVRNADDQVIRYDYNDPLRGFRPYLPDEVIHLRWDMDTTHKMSPTPLMPVVRYVLLDSAATVYSQVGIDNGPGGLLVQLMAEKGAGSGGSVARLEESQMRLLAKRIDTEWSRLRRGKPLVPGLPVEMKQFEPVIASLKHIHDLCEERICSRYGYPPAILGLGTGLEHADTRAAHHTMLKQAWTQGLMPAQDTFTEQLTMLLLPRWGMDDSYRLRFDRSGVEVLQADKFTQAKVWTMLYREEVAKRSEAREGTDLPVEAGDDVYKSETKPPPTVVLPPGQNPPPQGDDDDDDNNNPPNRPPPPTPPANRPRSRSATEVSRALNAMQRGLLAALEEAREEAARVMAEGLQESLEELGVLLSEAYLRAVETFEGQASRAAGDIPDDADLEHLRLLADRTMEWSNFTTWQADFDGKWNGGLIHTVTTTRGAIAAQMGITLGGPDEIRNRILADGGTRRGLLDLERKTKERVFHLLSTEPTALQHPYEVAKEIAKEVPSGPWRSSATRARVIARTETRYAQNVVAVDAYRETGFDQVQAVDNQVGFDDPDCMERDGKVFDIGDAERELEKEHPRGTLDFVPYDPLWADDPTPKATDDPKFA